MDIPDEFYHEKAERDKILRELSDGISETMDEDQTAANNFWELLDFIFEKLNWPFAMEHLVELGKGYQTKGWTQEAIEVINKELKKEQREKKKAEKHMEGIKNNPLKPFKEMSDEEKQAEQLGETESGVPTGASHVPEKKAEGGEKRERKV